MNVNKLTFAAALMVLAGNAFSADLTVSAAASLKDAFGEIINHYQKQYPQDKIQLNTAGSGALLQQALKGAPVDVLAFADEETMNQAQQHDLINKATRHTFAKNSLVIAVPQSSHLRVNNLADLTRSNFKQIAISNPASVPVGRYSKAALEKAKLWDSLQPKVINTQNVRQSLDYVARGEVDAGFVYNTDAALMKDKVRVVKVVPTQEPVSYPIAVVKNSTHAVEANRFENYVRSAAGQNVLKRYGFTH